MGMVAQVLQVGFELAPGHETRGHPGRSGYRVIADAVIAENSKTATIDPPDELVRTATAKQIVQELDQLAIPRMPASAAGRPRTRSKLRRPARATFGMRAPANSTQ